MRDRELAHEAWQTPNAEVVQRYSQVTQHQSMALLRVSWGAVQHIVFGHGLRLTKVRCSFARAGRHYISGGASTGLNATPSSRVEPSTPTQDLPSTHVHGTLPPMQRLAQEALAGLGVATSDNHGHLQRSAFRLPQLPLPAAQQKLISMPPSKQSSCGRGTGVPHACRCAVPGWG